MLKRLIFVTGFGVGFVVGSASGRKSYETLKQNALKTWHDPKVQEKVSEGADWVKAEVPAVGGKLADSAKKAAGAAGTKTSDASSGRSSGDTAAGGTASSDFADLDAATPVVTDSPVDSSEPFPAPGETQR